MEYELQLNNDIVNQQTQNDLKISQIKQNLLKFEYSPILRWKMNKYLDTLFSKIDFKNLKPLGGKTLRTVDDQRHYLSTDIPQSLLLTPVASVAYQPPAGDDSTI